MSSIKVLQLERWMDEDEWMGFDETDYMENNYPKTTPVFNRPGVYLTNDSCWFETLQGNTYIYDRKQFIWVLDTLSAGEIPSKAVDLMEQLIEYRLATPHQRKLVYFHRHFYELRDIRRGCDRLMRGFLDSIESEEE